MNDRIFSLNDKKKRGRLLTFLYEWLEALVVAFIVISLILTFLFRIVGVEGESMQDTLNDGDRLIISNLFHRPQQGDIIVISGDRRNRDNLDPGGAFQPLIKRIVATENQTVDIKGGYVYIDGNRMQEDYVTSDTHQVSERGLSFPVEIPPGYVFVLGDNRTGSHDSRSIDIGLVNQHYILGRVILRVFPLGEIGGVN